MNVLTTILLASLLGGSPEWKSVAPMGAGFSVSLPGHPEEAKQSLKGPQGTIAIRIFSLAAKDGTFVAGVTEHPEVVVPAGQDQTRLDQARDGAVQQIKGRPRDEKKITVEGRPGREFLVATDSGQTFKIRLIADRNRLFQVMVVGQMRFVESPDATKFLESFRFAK